MIKGKNPVFALLFLAAGVAAGWYFGNSPKANSVIPAAIDPATLWSADFKVVEIPSPIDGKNQNAYFFAAPSSSPQPLLVSLHSWSADYRQYDTLAILSQSRGIHYIHPDFRGINKTPDACCSPLAIADMDAAIDYAIAHANVDTTRIYVTGRSGGGYATVALFMKSRHPVKKFSSWVPLTDLVDWYAETKVRKLKYAPEILLCTNSENEGLNRAEAILRSPMYWKTPVEKFSHTSLRIYTGVNDGLEGNGPIPITHALNFYNKLLRDAGVKDSSSYVSDKDKLWLLEKRRPIMDYGKIADRDICLVKEWGNIRITIFTGGHEMLEAFAFSDLLDSDH